MTESILKRLTDDGTLVLYHDYRSGTFDDQTLNGNDGVPTNVTWAHDRVRFNNADGRIEVAADPSFDLSTSGTVLIFGEFKNNAVQGVFVCRDAILGVQYQLIIEPVPATSFRITFYNGVVVSRATHALWDNRCIAVSWIDDVVPVLYVDGIFAANHTAVANVTAKAGEIDIGNNFAHIAAFPDGMKACLVFNRNLTATEHAEVYGALRNLDYGWPSKPESLSKRPQISVPDPFLVRGWNMRPDGVNNYVQDVSPEGENLAPTTDDEWPKALGSLIGTALRFNHLQTEHLVGTAEDTYDATAPGSAIEVIFRAPTLATGGADEQVFANSYADNGSNHRVGIGYRNGEVIGTYYDGAFDSLSSEGVANTWMHVILNIDDTPAINSMFVNGVAAAASVNDLALSIPQRLVIAGNTALDDFCDCDVALVNFYVGRMFTAAEAAERALNMAKVVQFKTDWGFLESIGNETTGFFGRSRFPYNMAGGTVQVVVEEYLGREVKVVTATDDIAFVEFAYQHGDVDDSEEYAYGTWECVIHKADNQLSTLFSFINPTNIANYYLIQITAGGVTTIEAPGGTVIGGGVTVIGTTNHYKVTRDLDGTFNFWINGILVGTAVDNTITTSRGIAAVLHTDDWLCLSDITGNHAVVKYLGVV
jgi:hypothetical protein